MSDPASLRVAREKARQAFWTASCASHRDGAIDSTASSCAACKEAGAIAAGEAYAAALSGEPPAPTPEPAMRLNLAQMEAIYRWVISDPRKLPVAVSQAIERLYKVAGVSPVAPTAATPDALARLRGTANCGQHHKHLAGLPAIALAQGCEECGLRLVAAISDWHRRTNETGG